MKKAVAIFLMVLYGFAATGATIHAHYCMGRLISVNLFLGNPNVCANCGMAKEKSHGCCRDEQHQVQMHTDHQLVPAGCDTEAFSPIIITPFFSFTPATKVSATQVYPISNAPPGWPDKKRHILYCSFLI